MPENYRIDDLSNMGVPDGVPLSRDEVHKIVRLIFEDWAKGQHFASGRGTPVAPKLVPRTEGRSGVAVLQLEFQGAAGPNRAIPKFILRIFDPDCRQDADGELAKAERIKALDCEYFATDVKRFDLYPCVICYGHAGNRTGEVLPPLNAYFLDMLLAEGDDLPPKFEAFATRLQHVVKEVTRRYDSLEDGKVEFGSEYFARFRDGMPPDLWVVAPNGVKVYPERDGLKNVIAVKKSDDSIPAELDAVPELTDPNQLLGVGTTAAEEGHWVRVKGTFRNLRYAAAQSRQVCFMSGPVRVWLSLPSTVATPALEKVGYELVFSTKQARSGLARLQEMGFGEDALLGTDAFGKLCTEVGRIHRYPRHEDLHAGNVLASDYALKIIDVGGWDFDLPVSDVARLEVSLWYELAEKFRLDSQSTRELLDALMKDREPERLLAPETAGFLEVLGALRGGVVQYLQARAKEGGVSEEDSIREKETALAYVAQILLYQRYAVQDARTHISEAFNAFAVHWVTRLKKTVAPPEADAGPGPVEPVVQPASTPGGTAAPRTPAQPVAAPQPVPAQPAAGLAPDPPAPEEKSSPPRSAPTLFDLWRFALGPREGPPAGKVRAFLNALARGPMRTFLGNELKDLQMEIWKDSDRTNPFQDDLERHVLLSGPTSSGKTTVAEMFLAMPTLLKGERTSAIYVAPTRALAQARYRELRTLFEGVAEFENDAIVLSTGEDTDNDWRIVHGNFAIACMVYEKANIQFSRRSQLLRRIGCVVVDELHMLADLDRGPVLEVMLTKLVDERCRIDGETREDGREETIRLVAISTEDRPDGATRRFFSALDQAGTQEETVEPVLIHTDRRPVTVAHTLVLPGIESRRLPYTDHKIVEFKDTDGRKLNVEQLADHENRLHDKMTEIRKTKDKTRRRDVQTEVQNRLIAFLLDQLRNDPQGYRVLVFMPGKDVRLPLQLKNQRVSSKEPVNVNNLPVPEPILKALDKVEDKYLPNIIADCARAAVYIHHADVPYKVREEIEKLCGRPVGPSEPSQVVFCTETLSYGVNLALNDVVILGTKFNSSSRWRRREVRPLPACDYHNMAGRAGRLSKTPRNKQPGVYIFVPRDGEPFANVVKRYYKDIPKLESRLFVTEDMEKQRENALDRTSWLNGGVGPCAKFGNLKATDFSYPFVRSVLDVLRHLNYSRGSESDPDRRRPVSVEDVRHFFVRSLFHHQNSTATGKEDRKREFFECAIRSIIPECAKEPLLLVSQSVDHYTINDRGEAIIDTGTELRTVEPLLNIRRRVERAWEECCRGRPFPTALYTLCLVSVDEIYRNYLRHTPEFRNREVQESGDAAEGNEVFDDFVKTLMRIGVAETEAKQLAKRLRDALEGDTDAAQVAEVLSGADDSDAEPAAPLDARGVVHAVMRFFNAMIGWILDDEEPVVIRLVVGRQKQNLPGFTQSREQLAWKTIFFAKMLATAPRDPIRTEEQRELLTLASRFRHGCRAEAVRLFWPRNSDLTRVQAAAVLTATGNRPATLLSATHRLEVVGLDAVKLGQLRDDLRDHAVAQFSDLFQMLRVFQGGDDRHTQVRALLEEMHRGLFPDAVGQFPRSDRDSISLDQRMRDHLNFTKLDQKFLGTFPGERVAERYGVQIRIPKKCGVQLFGIKGKVRSERKAPEEPAWDDDPTHSVTILGVQLGHDWQVSTGTDWKPFPDLLDQQKASHLVLVCAPWLPSFEAPGFAAAKEALARRARDPEQTTAFVTPAAFGVLLVALAREFVGDPVMRRLTSAHPPGAFFNAVNVRDVLKIIDTSLATTGVRFPQGIRERLITHFEVEIETDGAGTPAGVAP